MPPFARVQSTTRCEWRGPVASPLHHLPSIAITPQYSLHLQSLAQYCCCTIVPQEPSMVGHVTWQCRQHTGHTSSTEGWIILFIRSKGNALVWYTVARGPLLRPQHQCRLQSHVHFTVWPTEIQWNRKAARKCVVFAIFAYIFQAHFRLHSANSIEHQITICCWATWKSTN